MTSGVVLLAGPLTFKCPICLLDWHVDCHTAFLAKLRDDSNPMLGMIQRIAEATPLPVVSNALPVCGNNTDCVCGVCAVALQSSAPVCADLDL